jgi:hypothetical protein
LACTNTNIRFLKAFGYSYFGPWKLGEQAATLVLWSKTSVGWIPGKSGYPPWISAQISLLILDEYTHANIRPSGYHFCAVQIFDI